METCFPTGSDCKDSVAVKETLVQSLGREDPLKKGMAATPVFLLENSMDRRAHQAIVPGVAKSWT